MMSSRRYHQRTTSGSAIDIAVAEALSIIQQLPLSIRRQLSSPSTSTSTRRGAGDFSSYNDLVDDSLVINLMSWRKSSLTKEVQSITLLRDRSQLMSSNSRRWPLEGKKIL
jgi:hypothetical protein